MKHDILHGPRHFFATAPLPCPYLSGRLERRVVTELLGRDVESLHDALSHAGFRRSHGVAYAPSCPDCDACVPVRVVVDGFVRSRGQRRIWNANQDLFRFETAPVATPEQFNLFAAYQRDRHADGDMALMDYLDYRALVEETTVDTQLLEYRDPAREDALVGACLLDRLSDGLSAVYSYYDPDLTKRSLGVFMVLDLIERARDLGLPHVYLGYWIDECRKMSYKRNFHPLEGLGSEGWKLLEDR